MSFVIPKGFQVAGVHSGVKRNPQKPDLTLVVCDRPATAAGVYTQNLITAAPVQLDQSRTPNDHTRAVVINSGNANACTGERGLADARRTTELAAAACGVSPDDVLVMSTGIIGEFMPMDKIEQGISAAAEKLGDDSQSLTLAARGMMTTDTVPKIAGRRLELHGQEVHIAGLAKGAAMIGPNMATMLALIMTDAALRPATAQQLLGPLVDETFNCIHVDGHTSTNDTVLLLASGAAVTEDELADDDLIAFRGALRDVCTELARAIPADGEGAQHLIEIRVHGCATPAAARQLARTVADSPLVKTAVAGADPNWGRIVSAAGYAGVPFDPGSVCLRVNGVLLYHDGSPVEFDGRAVSESIKNSRDTLIELNFAEGDSDANFWTTDLTVEYVRLNAEYHT